MTSPDHPARAPWQRPTLRGRIHQVAFFVAIPAGIALVAVARGATARAAAAVYALSLVGLFGASAAYHRIDWTPRARLRMKRLDHSMIFVLIAGTYTPFSLLALRGAWGIALLATVWTGAAVGIALKLARIDGFRRLGGAMYIILGWAMVAALPRIATAVSIPVLTLMVAGGVLYTVGAVVLFRRRPDPNPRVFGFHEIWHAMGVAAGACHYVAIVLIVRPAA